MKNPLVSIIIPTYNREKLILKAIDSVLKQSFQDFEILIIDDASTDATNKVIKELNNNRITYYRLDKNSGQCVARNYGIRKAKGTYIAFLDSDDEWLPEKLKLQVDCFKKGEDKLGAVYGHSYKKDMIKNTTELNNNNYYRGNIQNRFMEGFCPPTPSLFLVKKSALEKVNGFDEKLLTFVDIDLWLRLSEFYEFDYIEEPIIIKYEQIGDQYINNFEKRYKGLKLFLRKWEIKISDKDKENRLMNLKKHLTYAIVNPMLEHPPKNLRRFIFKLIGLLTDIKSDRLNLYLKALMILFFGPNIIYFIRKIRG